MKNNENVYLEEYLEQKGRRGSDTRLTGGLKINKQVNNARPKKGRLTLNRIFNQNCPPEMSTRQRINFTS
jgi:hypothetical protein